MQRKKAKAAAAGAENAATTPGMFLEQEGDQSLLKEELRQEVIRLLPGGLVWLRNPHELLGGDTPEARIAAGDLESVRNLLYSIVYIGIT